ncbi:MAG: methyltransferase domain-containing protein [Gammaproteobacteria bacterium]|jgi:predicted methyltransferase|nr:methyltransferase domain-containing protein [Gammaproteobacteria bacterium]
MSSIVHISLAIAIVLSTTLARAGDTGPETGRVVGPEINAYYHDADPARWLEVFERPGRELFDRRQEIVDALALRPGADVADVGAGTGLFTMLFASRVGPEGRVYAVDISRPFVEAIRERARAAGLENVIGIVNAQQGVELPAGSVDLVFIADTYHHFEYPHAMLASIHRALRPDGTLAVIDFRRLPGFSSAWVMGHVRAGRAQVIREVRAAGFELVEEPVQLDGNYFLRFRKRAG